MRFDGVQMRHCSSGELHGVLLVVGGVTANETRSDIKHCAAHPGTGQRRVVSSSCAAHASHAALWPHGTKAFVRS